MGNVTVQLTNGFGNNIFQYVAARLLAEHHNSELCAIPPHDKYYAINDLSTLGIKFINHKYQKQNSFLISEKNYLEAFSKNYSDADLLLNGYFEDYTYYFKHIEKIKSWFPKQQVRNNNDLVIHMRTGDRLFMKNEFYSKPRAMNYLRAINKFEFNQLHIVTDMPVWDYVTENDLKNFKFHVNIAENKRVPIAESVKYFNEIVEAFSFYSPIIKKRGILEDFNHIRSFKNILFEHGTLSWWAAVLSSAKKVGVYGPWRPWKAEKNKNLSDIPIDTWFKWE
tara:strand:- start:53517 stop:54356 length:840 start_codon:yes stop_codon:yes gene_type:complete